MFWKLTALNAKDRMKSKNPMRSHLKMEEQPLKENVALVVRKYLELENLVNDSLRNEVK